MTTTIFSNVSSAEQLSDDILAIDRASRADGGNGTPYSITLAPNATLTEQADIAAINLAGKDTLTLDGQGAFLNGDDAFRGLFAYSGAATIENLTIENAVANGPPAAPVPWRAAEAARASAAAYLSPIIRPEEQPRRTSRSPMSSS
jgi:hypothetical protein